MIYRSSRFGPRFDINCNRSNTNHARKDYPIIDTKYGEDIANKLQNNMRVILPSPDYSNATLTHHALWIALIRSQQVTMKAAWLTSHTSLEAEISHTPGNQPYHWACKFKQRYCSSGLQGGTGSAYGADQTRAAGQLIWVPQPEQKGSHIGDPSRTGLLSHSWAVHTATARQNEARHFLDVDEHILWPA